MMSVRRTRASPYKVFVLGQRFTRTDEHERRQSMTDSAVGIDVVFVEPRPMYSLSGYLFRGLFDIVGSPT
jgi:hypothetical protein